MPYSWMFVIAVAVCIWVFWAYTPLILVKLKRQIPLPENKHIEEIKRLFTKMSEYQEELDVFFENSPLLLCVAKRDGFFVKVNKSWMNVLGYTREELLSAPYDSFIHPQDLAMTNAVLVWMDGDGLVNGFRNRYRKKDGDYVTIHWLSSQFIRNKSYALGVVE